CRGPPMQPGSWIAVKGAGMRLTEERVARAYLLRVAEPPAAALAAFVSAHGPTEAAERVRARQVPPAVAQETEARAHLTVTAADLERAQEKLRSEEHTSELQSRENRVCRLLLEKKQDITLEETY